MKTDTTLNIGIDPIELTQKTIKPEQMNYAQLLNFDYKLKENGINDPKWEVNLHFKKSFSMSSFIFILFGLIKGMVIMKYIFLRGLMKQLYLEI